MTLTPYVLLVEADSLLREVYTMLFSHQDCPVVCVSNEQEALEHLQSNQPAALLYDLPPSEEKSLSLLHGLELIPMQQNLPIWILAEIELKRMELTLGRMLSGVVVEDVYSSSPRDLARRIAEQISPLPTRLSSAEAHLPLKTTKQCDTRQHAS